MIEQADSVDDNIPMATFANVDQSIESDDVRKFALNQAPEA